MLLANTPTQAESLLHSLEQVVGGIDIHVKAEKTEYQKADISTLDGGSLKLVDKFTYFRKSISSPEDNINVQLAQA